MLPKEAYEARKRGMKFGAYVNEVLRGAVSPEAPGIAGLPQELLTKIAELNFKENQPEYHQKPASR